MSSNVITCINLIGCRFSKAAIFPYSEQLNIRCRISTSMLSPGVMYAASLVFSFQRGRENVYGESSKLARINWKYQELSVSSTHIAEREKDGWLKIRLWHFLNGDKNAEFYVVLDKISYFKEEQDISNILIHQIEFEPVPMVSYSIYPFDYNMCVCSIHFKLKIWNNTDCLFVYYHHNV